MSAEGMPEPWRAFLQKAVKVNTNKSGGAGEFRKLLRSAAEINPDVPLDAALKAFKSNSSGRAKKILKDMLLKHGQRQTRLQDHLVAEERKLPRATDFKHWSEVLAVERAGLCMDKVVRAFRRRALLWHPDKGGSNELMAALVAAKDDAMAELRRQDAERCSSPETSAEPVSSESEMDCSEGECGADDGANCFNGDRGLCACDSAGGDFPLSQEAQTEFSYFL